MLYQYVREPLTTERLVVWTMLDTRLRVDELCGLTSKDVLDP